MVFRNKFFKGGINYKLFGFIIAIWFCTEVVYQFYLRHNYIQGKDYRWEERVIKSNLDKLSMLQSYFSTFQQQNFVYGLNPNEGSLNGIPDSIQNALNSLNRNLTWGGIGLPKSFKNFTVAYIKSADNKYTLTIDAGRVFKDSWNGYNLSLIVTNKGDPSNPYVKYQRMVKNDFYVETQSSRDYRHLPLILHYNCNSYDLLILRLFR